ncbi:2412_t:CDS:2 [Funneliformis geosporum]|uniref:2412_t:CDS:1 n=1 Tax=Funneliformis geosporum TaxID=1117311 RepID=A0A9W4SYL1_9GLOM|nr:2412_t:CDS:2 [Funneliformis geosporum]
MEFPRDISNNLSNKNLKQYFTGLFVQEQNEAFPQFFYQNFVAPNYSYNVYNQFLRGTSKVNYINIKKESGNLQRIDLTQEKDKFDVFNEELEVKSYKDF